MSYDVYMCQQFNLALAFVDVLSQNRIEIVWKSSLIENSTEPVRCPRGVPMISD